MRLVVVRSDSATKQQPSRNWYTTVREDTFILQFLYQMTIIQSFKGSDYSNRSSSVPQVLPARTAYPSCV